MAGIPFAWRNLSMGRADRTGTLRFALLVGGCQMLIWIFGLQHTTNVSRELNFFRDFLHPWTGYMLRLWVYYLALEPYVRRYWPNVLVAWTRAFNGRLRDPLLGRELLFGCAAGLGIVAFYTLVQGIAVQFGATTSMNGDPDTLIWLTGSVLTLLQSEISWGPCAWTVEAQPIRRV